MRTKSCFPLDASAEISKQQKLWLEIIDKDTQVTFKGVLSREEFAEVIDLYV